MAKKKNNLPVGYIEINNDRYHVRKDPDTNSDSYGKPSKGDKLPFLGVVKKAWVKVLLGDKVGWIHNQAGKIVEIKQTYLTVKKGNWHVKSAPNAKGKSLGVVHGGDKILDQGQTQGGYRLVVFENQNGWISSRGVEAK